jgi:methylmalonyl-CoA mutase N-terminal domain/subunit
MRTLLDGIPPGEMNTSMTINAPAAWLLGLYVANAEEQGVATSGAARHHPERHRQGVPVAAAPTSSRRSRRAG